MKMKCKLSESSLLRENVQHPKLDSYDSYSWNESTCCFHSHI